MLGFLRKVQTSLFLYYDLWNKSTNEIWTPLIDCTIRIATKMPFSNANNYYSLVRCFRCRLVQYFLYRSELTMQKSSSTKHIPFKKFIPSFLQAKGNWNTFLTTVSGIIRQYNLHYYTSDSPWKIWLVESIQSIHNSLWTWHDKWNICCRYCIYHVKFNVCLVTKPLGVFSSETEWLNASLLFLRMDYVLMYTLFRQRFCYCILKFLNDLG